MGAAPASKTNVVILLADDLGFGDVGYNGGVAQTPHSGSQSGQPTVFSGTYIITVLQYVDTWLILQLCVRSGPTGTPGRGNSVPRTKRRAQAPPRRHGGLAALAGLQPLLLRGRGLQPYSCVPQASIHHRRFTIAALDQIVSYMQHK